jgi:hypothetical protein
LDYSLSQKAHEDFQQALLEDYLFAMETEVQMAHWVNPRIFLGLMVVLVELYAPMEVVPSEVTLVIHA